MTVIRTNEVGGLGPIVATPVWIGLDLSTQPDRVVIFDRDEDGELVISELTVVAATSPDVAGL